MWANAQLWLINAIGDASDSLCTPIPSKFSYQSQYLHNNILLHRKQADNPLTWSYNLSDNHFTCWFLY